MSTELFVVVSASFFVTALGTRRRLLNAQACYEGGHGSRVQDPAKVPERTANQASRAFNFLTNAVVHNGCAVSFATTSTMPEPLITLGGEGEPIMMCPIEIFRHTYLFPSLCFGMTDRDGSEKRYVCCVHQRANPQLLLPKTPLVFSVYGQIAVEDCFLTARGRLRPMDEEPVGSCWLQARPNIASDIRWRGIIPTIEAIVDEFGGVVDFSHLLMLGSDEKVRLQVIWQGDVGKSGRGLPIFDKFGTQRVPASISEVPFGEAVHAVFSLQFVHNRRAETRTVFVSLFAMFKA